MAIAATATLLGLTGGCGVPTDPTARSIADDDVAYDLLSPTTTSLPAASAPGGETAICLPFGDSLLVLSRTRSGEPPLRTLTDLVAAAPTEGESTLGIRSSIEPDDVEGVVQNGEEATVKLSPEFVDLAADQQLLAVAQMTCTLTGQPGIQAVQFVMDDRDVAVPVQGGALIERPVTRADYDGLIAR